MIAHTPTSAHRYQQQFSEYRRIVNGRATNGNILYDAEDFNPGFAKEVQNNHRMVLGVRGEWRNWQYTVSHTRAENHFETINSGGFINATNWGTSLTTAERLQDPASYSDATWAKIKARYADPTTTQEYRMRLQDTQLQASRTVGENQWGDIKLGAKSVSKPVTDVGIAFQDHLLLEFRTDLPLHLTHGHALYTPRRFGDASDVAPLQHQLGHARPAIGLTVPAITGVYRHLSGADIQQAFLG